MTLPILVLTAPYASRNIPYYPRHRLRLTWMRRCCHSITRLCFQPVPWWHSSRFFSSHYFLPGQKPRNTAGFYSGKDQEARRAQKRGQEHGTGTQQLARPGQGTRVARDSVSPARDYAELGLY